MISVILIAACIVIGFLYEQSKLYVRHRHFRRRHQCQQATQFPQYERILGIDLVLENLRCWKAGRLLDQLRSRFERVGNTYSATVAGTTTFFTMEPENIKAIFADRIDDFDSGWLRRRAFAPSIGDVLITADGPRWHSQRAMLRPAFNRHQFSDFGFFERAIDDLIQRIPDNGSTIDLAPLFNTYSLTLASKLLFDEPLASSDSDISISSDRFAVACRAVMKGTEKRIRMGRLLFLQPRDHSYEAACRVVHGYGDLFVQRALDYRQSWRPDGVKNDEETPERYIFLQELAKEVEDPQELRNQFLGMLLAGSETTGNLLTNCLNLLSSRPGLWAKLRKQAISLGVPNRDGVRNFAPLSHFINEVLRFYPVVPLYGRMANKDTFLPTGGGPLGTSRVFVPKGALAMINTHSLQRRSDIFGDDSHEFKPERWVSLKTLDHWSYLPFSGGPRVCIGQQYALMEASYTLVRLLQVFPTIESRESRPWRECLGITLKNENGAKVAFKAA